MKHVPQGHGSKDGTRTKGTARAHQAGHQPECHARHHGTKTTEQNQGAHDDKQNPIGQNDNCRQQEATRWKEK